MKAELDVWLKGLTTSPEFAIGFADAYASLSPQEKDEWLEHLATVALPPQAIYLPLVAVETDPERVARILKSMTAGLSELPKGGGADAVSRDVCVYSRRDESTQTLLVCRKLYLEFSAVLECVLGSDEFVVKEHAFCNEREWVKALDPAFSKLPLEDAALLLGTAIVRDKSRGRPPPPALYALVPLFDVASGRP